jgi:hypothetical protein
MKKATTFLIMLLSIISASATLIDDPFNSGANWSTPTTTGDGVMSFQNNQLEYTTITSTGSSGGHVDWNNPYQFASYNQSFDMKVDVHTPSYAIPAGKNYSLAFQVEEVGTPDRVFSLTLFRDDSGQTMSGQLRGNGQFGPTQSLSGLYTDFSWKIAYDSGTRTLTSSYDLDGAANGYSWTTLSTGDITAPLYGWNMNASDHFKVLLRANSNDLSIASGDITFDSFQMNVVPEPSTYALLILGVLFLIQVVRRQAKS